MAEYEQLKYENNNFEKEEDREVLEQDLIAVGIFGLQDPLRPDIEESIKVCQGAGIKVIMCTGDNLDTAKAISINAGIITEDQLKEPYACMTGQEFADQVGPIVKIEDPKNPGQKIDIVKNLNKFREIEKSLRVMARSSPEDKYLLVTGLQQAGGVVAVTGDGSNDAPALNKADVGFSMGITGTDIAKGACDIILLDDNFGSILVALTYGRCVFDNVRKFLQFQLTINIAALYICFISSAILRSSPLNAVDMLWINLIMDTLGACALASEPPAKDILKRKPQSKDTPIMTDVMWRNIMSHAIFQMIIISVLIFFGQGVFCYHYETKCFQYATDGSGECESWNPFYASDLYITAQDQEWWQALNLTANDFDQAALKNFICYNYEINHGLSSIDCTEEIYGNPANFILPSELPLNSMTQQLLHYTFIFNIFVFMQLWNQFNARFINLNDMNPFKGFFSNWTFLGILIMSAIVQMALVKYGGEFIQTYPLT